MAAYCRVYDSRYLQADYQEPGSAPEPYARQSSMGYPLPLPYLLATKRHTRTHPFNGPLYGTTRVSRYQKGKTNLDFTEARDSEWQWHQLPCASLHLAPHR